MHCTLSSDPLCTQQTDGALKLAAACQAGTCVAPGLACLVPAEHLISLEWPEEI